MFMYILDMDYENNIRYTVPVRETQYQVIQNISRQVKSLLFLKIIFNSIVFIYNEQQNEMRNEKPTRVCMFTLY